MRFFSIWYPAPIEVVEALARCKGFWSGHSHPHDSLAPARAGESKAARLQRFNPQIVENGSRNEPGEVEPQYCANNAVARLPRASIIAVGAIFSRSLMDAPPTIFQQPPTAEADSLPPVARQREGHHRRPGRDRDVLLPVK
jgi:hypothetical protein